MKKLSHHTVQIIQRVFVILFFILLLFPLVQQRFNVISEVKLDENRVREKFPTFIELQKLPSFLHGIQIYVDDSFGFRDTLIRMKNQIDLSLFGISEKVYVNPGGYLFSREFDNKYRAEISAASPEHWLALFSKIDYLQQTLKQRGITLVFVPVPLADSIYPEEFSHIPNVGYGEKLYRKFYDFFDSKNIAYVDIIGELRKHKGEPIYYKTDIHYTQVGGFYVMRAMLNDLYRRVGNKRVWDYPLRYNSEGFSGGLNKYLGAFHTYPDRNPTVERNWEVCSKVSADNIWETICPNRMVLPPSAIFGNSYMTWLLQSGFADQFPVLYPYLVTDLNLKIRTLPKETKIVIIEFYEIDVWNFLYGGIFPEVGTMGNK